MRSVCCCARLLVTEGLQVCEVCVRVRCAWRWVHSLVYTSALWWCSLVFQMIMSRGDLCCFFFANYVVVVCVVRVGRVSLLFVFFVVRL